MRLRSVDRIFPVSMLICLTIICCRSESFIESNDEMVGANTFEKVGQIENFDGEVVISTLKLNESQTEAGKSSLGQSLATGGTKSNE